MFRLLYVLCYADIGEYVLSVWWITIGGGIGAQPMIKLYHKAQAETAGQKGKKKRGLNLVIPSSDE